MGEMKCFRVFCDCHCLFHGFLPTGGMGWMIIGVIMFYKVGRMFLANTRGAIGETDEEMLIHIGNLVIENPHVKDIVRLEVINEGEFLHVEPIA